MTNHNDDLFVLENTVSELLLLSKRQPLKDDLLRAKDLMASLKESSYTNEEISLQEKNGVNLQ